MANVFLYAPRNFHNLGLLSRTLEVFGQSECYVFDPHRLVRDRYGKARSRELRAVSAGAFDQLRWTRIEEPLRFLRGHEGAVVSTVAEPQATALGGHHFSRTDLLVFGSENQGLPPEIVAASGATVTIPSHGKTQSLNLAVALGIVLFEWQRQVGVAVAEVHRGAPPSIWEISRPPSNTVV